MIHDPNVLQPWHIASYPRSGNHLVRALVEFASHRPTLGCPGSTRDTPIHSRDPNAKADVIAISDSKPIACKSHFLEQILRHSHDAHAGRFLLITRDPVAAISSHLARSVGKKLYVSDRALRILVERELNTYLSLLYAYRSQPEPQRAHIRFEDLIAVGAKSLAASNALLKALDPKTPDLTAPQLDQIRALAKDSQSSLKPRKTAARDRIRPIVSARLTEADVRQFLSTGLWD
ncbi:hypothetical protein [Falsiphaeobacter marinintestinus]|uniref:hypothetical protein n=1 Tax=Falsiphaeobacter marinintestinus TaxID=1492905 RepID=UPI0011B51898|nr:hypothetical protein [Phaeobacter marinintestinus]